MQITKTGENLIIKFDYNPALIEVVKQFDSRKFNPDTKEWIVPAIHVKKVLETLIPLGFSASQTVRDDFDSVIKYKQKIERILAGEFKESEKEALHNTDLPLFDFQKIGTGFLCATKSSLLGDEPGLGKSIQALATTVIGEAKRVLVICPSTLKLNWRDEISKWMKDKKVIVITGEKKKRNELWAEEANYHIANYEILLRDIDEIKKKDWDYIIADEATRISNPKAKQSKLIKTIPAKHRIALTGTPLNNAVQDIWNILDFCQPNILGSFWQFTSKYCEKDRFGGIVSYKNLNDLKLCVADNMLRRKKNEVLRELPDKLYETIYVEFDEEEKKIYEAVKNEIVNELREYAINRVLDDKYLSNALVKMIRLKQVTGSLELVSEHRYSSKINALKELLEDIIHNGSKALVFTQFSEMADILVRELDKYKPLLISGKVENEDRKLNVDKFQNNEENRVLISTEAGGYGLNLFRAQYVIHYDLPWSISKMEQREGRAHRIGQKNNLTVFRLIVEKTVDEYVMKVLHKKQKMSEEVLGDKERIKKIKLSKNDIMKMLE
ncbi:MAG: DEAD/DEAH box helicase [Methanogenium sp.]|jgi:SNF2 family DNA or RNA helicase